MPYCTNCGNDVTGRKFCTNCGQQVKQRTPPPPEPVPTNWWSQQHDRSWWIKQIAGIGALVLVAGAAAYGVTWFNGRNAKAAGTGPGSPTAAPEAPRVCWDKSKLEGTEQCPMPYGLDGIAALSPAIKDAYRGELCRETMDVRDIDSHTCEVTIPGHGKQTLIIDSYESTDEVDREADYYENCQPVPDTEVEACRGKEYNDQDALRFTERKLHYLIVIDKEAGGTEALKALPWTPLNTVLNP